MPRRSRPCLYQPATARPRRRGSGSHVRDGRSKRLVQRYYQDVLAGRRLDVLELLVSPTFVGHDPSGATMDRDGYFAAVRMSARHER